MPSVFLIIILCICAILTWSLGIFILAQRNLKDLRSVAMTLIGAGLYCGGYGMELNASSLQEMLMWNKLEYIGIVIMCPSWVLFTLNYTGRKECLSELMKSVLWGIPVLTVAFKLFEQKLGFIYQDIGVDPRFNTLTFTRMPWYYVQMAYEYSCGLGGIYILMRYGRNRLGPGKTRLFVLMSLPCIVLTLNLVYVTEIRHIGSLDLTPFGICISTTILYIVIIRQDILALTPVARTFIIEHLPQGIMVFDKHRRLCEANEAARALLALSPTCLGMPAGELFTPLFCEKALPQTGRTIFEISINGRDLEVHTNIIGNKYARRIGWVISLVDISERKRTEMRLEQLLRSRMTDTDK